MSQRVAVVGVGHLGRFHAQKLKQLPDVTLAALVEPNAERRRAMQAEFSVPVCAEVSELVDVDAAIVATPTSEHLSVSSTLISRGIHVLVEKPVVRDEDDARALRSVSQKYPEVVVAVGHSERFNPAVVATKQLEERPLYIVGERLGPFKERSVDIDVIDDLMIHDLDLVLSWVRSPVREVRAVGVSIMTDHIDMADARIEFESGAVASLSASRSSLESSRKLRLFTARRYLSLDLEKKQVKFVRRLTASSGDKWPEIEGGMLDVPASDALMNEDAAFLRACRGEPSPIVTLEDGIAAVSLAARIKRELRTPGIERTQL
jgi:predicted dehydrogenase